jgi:hypothetical protein
MPGAARRLHIDAGGAPKCAFAFMGAAVIAARCENRRLAGNALQRRGGVLRSPDAGGVGLWTDKNEIIVHHVVPLQAVALGDEFFL